MFDYIVFIGLNIFLFSIELNDCSQVDPKVYCTNISYLQSVIVIWSCTRFFLLFFFVQEIKTFMMVSNSITNDNMNR